MAEILDGRSLAEKIKKEVKAEVKKHRFELPESASIGEFMKSPRMMG